jgi:hypothetical protein
MYVQREGQQDISIYMVETPGKLVDTTLHDVRYVIQHTTHVGLGTCIINP